MRLAICFCAALLEIFSSRAISEAVMLGLFFSNNRIREAFSFSVSVDLFRRSDLSEILILFFPLKAGWIKKSTSK